MCNFWRVVLDVSPVTKLLPQVYVSQDVLPKPKKNNEVQSQHAKNYMKRWGVFWIGYRSQENTEYREMGQSLDQIMLTVISIIWMVYNQEFMVENKKINILI